MDFLTDLFAFHKLIIWGLGALVGIYLYLHKQWFPEESKKRERYRPELIITTAETLPNADNVEQIALVRGGTVRSRNILLDFFESLRNVFGGELDHYTELQDQARDEAIRRMEAEALALGADAIVRFRIGTARIVMGSSEILAYGTAVKIKDE